MRLFKKNNSYFVEWLRRDQIKFTDPFFGQTVDRIRSKGGRRAVKIVTDVDSLLKFSTQTKHTCPAAFIFHISRCGSTLLSQVLSQDSKNLVLSEPSIFNDISLAKSLSVSMKLALFVAAIEAFKAAMLDGEGRIIIKFASSTEWLRHLQKIYPKSKFLIVYREPVAVIDSNLRGPPDRLLRLPKKDRRIKLIESLEYQMKVFAKSKGPSAALLNYKQIRASFLPELIQFLNLKGLSKSTLVAMRSRFDFYSKSNEKTLWREEKRAIAKVPREIIKIYRDLERVRRAQERFFSEPPRG